MNDNIAQVADVQEVAAALAKALPDGQLPRIPKHPRRREIVVALLSLALERRYPYTEIELKEVLLPALAAFNARVDHVTCRRYLVDLGFMKRDRAGSRYYLNFPRLEATLNEAVREQAPQLVAAAIAERQR